MIISVGQHDPRIVMKVGEIHASQSSSSSQQKIENISVCHSVFSFVKIHTHGTIPLAFSITCLLSPQPAPLLYAFSALDYSSICLFISSGSRHTPFPLLEKMATASSMAWVWVGPQGSSVSTGWHSVQVEGPGYLPIGISKQDIRETGLQHV